MMGETFIMGLTREGKNLGQIQIKGVSPNDCAFDKKYMRSD